MSTSITEWLHQRLHTLPGMPPHSAARRRNQNRRVNRHHGRRLPNPNGHHARAPRVLVAWQNWIGRGGRR